MNREFFWMAPLPASMRPLGIPLGKKCENRCIFYPVVRSTWLVMINPAEE